MTKRGLSWVRCLTLPSLAVTSHAEFWPLVGQLGVQAMTLLHMKCPSKQPQAAAIPQTQVKHVIPDRCGVIQW